MLRISANSSASQWCPDPDSLIPKETPKGFLGYPPAGVACGAAGGGQDSGRRLVIALLYADCPPAPVGGLQGTP
jgi:hypothetical protein